MKYLFVKVLVLNDIEAVCAGQCGEMMSIFILCTP